MTDPDVPQADITLVPRTHADPVTDALLRVARHLAALIQTHGEVFDYQWELDLRSRRRVYGVTYTGDLLLIRYSFSAEPGVMREKPELLLFSSLEEKLAFFGQLDDFLACVHRYYKELPARKAAALAAVDAALAKDRDAEDAP